MARLAAEASNRHATPLEAGDYRKYNAIRICAAMTARRSRRQRRYTLDAMRKYLDCVLFFGNYEGLALFLLSHFIRVSLRSS